MVFEDIGKGSVDEAMGKVDKLLDEKLATLKKDILEIVDHTFAQAKTLLASTDHFNIHIGPITIPVIELELHKPKNLQ